MITFTLLASLQAINLFWLFLILRIAYNVVVREPVKDVRSDDEGEDDEVIEKRQEKKINGTAIEGHETTKPAVLLNGKAVGDEALAHANGHANGGVKRGDMYANAEEERKKVI